MSSNIEVVIEAPRPEELPAKLITAAEIGSPDALDDQTADRPARWVLQWWDEKYGVGDLPERLARLSAAFPTSTITLEEEWDDEGPGWSAWVWRAGDLIRTGEMVKVWTDTHADTGQRYDGNFWTQCTCGLEFGGRDPDEADYHQQMHAVGDEAGNIAEFTREHPELAARSIDYKKESAT